MFLFCLFLAKYLVKMHVPRFDMVSVEFDNTVILCVTSFYCFDIC